MYTQETHNLLHNNDPMNVLIIILNFLGYTSTGIALHTNINDTLEILLKVFGLINITVSIILIIIKIKKTNNGK